MTTGHRGADVLYTSQMWRSSMLSGSFVYFYVMRYVFRLSIHPVLVISKYLEHFEGQFGLKDVLY